MTDHDNDLSRMAQRQSFDRRKHARLQLDEGLTPGEPEAGRMTQDGLHARLLRTERNPAPVHAPAVALDKPGLDFDGKAGTNGAICSAVSTARSIGEE